MASSCYVSAADYARYWGTSSDVWCPVCHLEASDCRCPRPATTEEIFVALGVPDRRRGPERRHGHDRRWDAARGRRFRLGDRRG
jgi:hypothetical protein